MVAATGRAAGTVLDAKADRCGAFTKEGAAAVREAVAKATVGVFMCMFGFGGVE